jgi:uncharacterized protein YxeA
MKRLLIGIGSILILAFVAVLFVNADDVTKDSKKAKTEVTKKMKPEYHAQLHVPTRQNIKLYHATLKNAKKLTAFTKTVSVILPPVLLIRKVNLKKALHA